MTVTNATMTSVTSKRGRRGLALGFVVTTAAALFVGGMGATAMADADDTTVVSVEVSSVLDLVITSANFELNGLPGATVSLVGAVAYNVATNNESGYTVTVEAEDDVMTGASALDDGTVPDTIPVEAMTVEQDGSVVDGPQVVQGPTGAPVELHTQAVRSDPSADEYTNDYSIVIPYVTPDTYSVTLNYLATAAA